MSLQSEQFSIIQDEILSETSTDHLSIKINIWYEMMFLQYSEHELLNILHDIEENIEKIQHDYSHNSIDWSYIIFNNLKYKINFIKSQLGG